MGKYVRYSDEFLDQVRKEADLVGLISRDITLKKSGKNFIFKSPPLLVKFLSSLETDFNTAVGPEISLPYTGDIPPSANGVPEYLPSADAPTFSPIGTCADTVYIPV